MSLASQRLSSANVLPKYSSVCRLTNSTSPAGVKATTNPGMLSTISRDSRSLYVTNRTSGTVSVIDVVSRRMIATWKVGGSPDLAGLSANGNVLWLADTYGNTAYALSTKDGAMLAKISVGKSPLGLTVWPQPGRFALGGTGTLR